MTKAARGYATNFSACCINWGSTSKICEVWAYDGDLSPATLAHEFVHVGLEYIKRLKKDDLRGKVNENLPYEERPEEILCYAVQELLDKALLGLYDHG